MSAHTQKHRPADARTVKTTLRALVAEARPSGRLTLTLFGPHDPSAVIAEMLAASLAARAWADAIPNLMRGAQPDCGACGRPLGYPATVAVLHADQPNARAAMALGCCDACTAGGPAVLRQKLLDYLGTIFPGLRSGAPTHAGPDALQ